MAHDDFKTRRVNRSKTVPLVGEHPDGAVHRPKIDLLSSATRETPTLPTPGL